jgi:hypothetical protein
MGDAWYSRGNDFWLQLEKYGELGRDEKLSPLRVIFCEIGKRGQLHVGSVALSKQATHYDSRSVFLSELKQN